MAGSLFRFYDGPGPITRAPITQQIYTPVIDVTKRDAANAPGLFVNNWGPVLSPQTAALRLPPGVEFPGQELEQFQVPESGSNL